MAKCTGMRCPMQVSYKVEECDYKDCPYRTEPMTNAGRIRAMSDEELADLIQREVGYCPPTGYCEKTSNDCEACWLDWLKQPSEVEE